MENYDELCLWFHYAIKCSLFFQVCQRLLLNYNDSTKSVLVYTGGHLVFLRLQPQVKSFRTGKPTNFIAVYVHQNGRRFQNPNLSQEGNSSMAEKLFKCAINFPVMNCKSCDFISSLYPHSQLFHK
jgi:hypothetical protein